MTPVQPPIDQSNKPGTAVMEQPGLNKESHPKEIKRDIVKERKELRHNRLTKLEKSVVLSPYRLDALQLILKESGADSMEQKKALDKIQNLFNPRITQLSKDEEKEMHELIKLNEDKEHEWTSDESKRLDELESRVELAKINGIIWGSRD